MSNPTIHNADELEALALERGLLPFFACGVPDCSIEDFTPSRYWFAEGVDAPGSGVWRWPGGAWRPTASCSIKKQGW